MFESILASFVTQGPKFRVVANGNDITESLGDNGISIEASQSVDEKSDGLTLALFDLSKDIALPKRGARLEVSVGYGQNLEVLGSYIVDEVEVSSPPNQITITGTSTPFTADAFGGQASMITRRSQSYDNVTVGQLMQTIAKRNGLTAKVQEELAGITFEHIDQVNESDTNFALRIARDAGGVLTPMDSQLVLVDERGGKTASGKPLDTVFISESQVIRWRARFGHRMNDCKKAETQFHDYDTATLKAARIDVPKDSQFYDESGGD